MHDKTNTFVYRNVLSTPPTPSPSLLMIDTVSCDVMQLKKTNYANLFVTSTFVISTFFIY